MIFEASDFIFEAPSLISRARRVLIKPDASHPAPYPMTTSPQMLLTIIEGIRKVSDADILLLEGTSGEESIYPIYQALGYKFPRVLTLDVKDAISVEVDNPLPKPLAIPTFWIPNVILSSDYLITVAPLKTFQDKGCLSLMNLLSLLPSNKYGSRTAENRQTLYNLGIDKVIADLYFTLPFDLGIIEARQKLIGHINQGKGQVEECGKVFIGEPFKVDCEAAESLNLKVDYLNLIREAKTEFDN